VLYTQYLEDLPFIACTGQESREYQKFTRIAFDHFFKDRLQTKRTSCRKLLSVCITYSVEQGGQKDR